MVGIHIASSVRNQRENAGALFLCPCHLPHHTHNFRLLFKPIICQFLKCFIIYVCKCASGFRCPWSWIEGGCEQPTWVWELTWLLCKSRQRSSLLSHFFSLPTFPFLFRQRSQPMEWWAMYVHLSASARALETGTSKVMYHPGHSKPKQVDREEKLTGTAGYILAMGRNLV